MNFLWLDWHNIHTVHVSLLQKVLEQRAEVFTMKVYKATIHDHPVCICDGFKQIIKIQRQEWIHCLWLRICLLSFLGKESCQSWIYAKHTSKFASMRPQKSWWPITHRRDVQVHTAPFGVSFAPGIFQLVMEEVLQGVPNVVVYLDEIWPTAIWKTACETTDWNPGLASGSQVVPS